MTRRTPVNKERIIIFTEGIEICTKKEMIKAEIRPKEDMNIRNTIGFLTYLLMTCLSTTPVIAHKNCASKVKSTHDIIINLN